MDLINPRDYRDPIARVDARLPILLANGIFLLGPVTAGFRGMYFTSNDGSVCEIFAEYKIGDNWQIAPGYMFFNGSKDSRLGQYSENDMVYLRLRYSF